MPRYEVTVWLGAITHEVDAENEDEAITEAQDYWDTSGTHWMDATYEARQIEP